MSDFTTATPPVYTTVYAGTAHTSEEDWVILDGWAAMEFTNTSVPVRVIRHGYGYLIETDASEHAEGYSEERAEHRQEAREAGLSESFIALLYYAEAHGHRWINLDRDYDSIEGLPVQEHL